MRIRFWGFLIPVVLVLGGAWIWLFRVPPSTNLAQQQAAPLVGYPAPDFSLQTLDGENLSLSGLKGHPVVLNFWASWCGPCQAEMPELQQAYKRNAGDGLVVLGVNQGEPQAVAADFVQSMGLTFPIVLDPQMQASRAYQTQALPTTYFIDRNGIIRAQIVGQMNTAVLRQRLRSIFP